MPEIHLGAFVADCFGVVVLVVAGEKSEWEHKVSGWDGWVFEHDW